MAPGSFKNEVKLRNPRIADCSSFSEAYSFAPLLTSERISSHTTHNVRDPIPVKNTNQKKGFTLVEIMIVVVIIGLLAAMAIPAFQKVRQASQDKAVLNNARQLSAAADQYYLEYGGSTVAQSMLLGPQNYVNAHNTVPGETYPTTFQSGQAISITGVAGLRTITYAP